MTRLTRAAFLLAAFSVLSTGVAPAQAPEPVDRRDAQGDPLPAHALARLGTLRWRHGGAITFVAHTRDGQGLVTDSQDGSLRLWDLATGTEVRRFVKHAKMTTDDYLRGLALFRSQRHGAALSPDGKLLAAGDFDGTITLWDFATAKVLRTLKQPGNTPLASLVFADDSELLLAKDHQQVLRVWDVSAGTVLRTFKRDGPDFGFAAGALTGNPAFLSAGAVVASVFAEFTDDQFVISLRRWDQVTGRELPPVRLQENGNLAGAVAFTPDGKTIALAGGFEEPIRLIDLNTGKRLHEFGMPTKSFATQVAFTPDGKTLAAWNTDQTIHFWDATTGKELRRIGEPSGPRFRGIYLGNTTVSNLVFSADGKYLTLGTSGSTIRRWEVDTGRELLPVNGHQGAVVALTLSADGKTVITRGTDHAIYTWDFAGGRETGRLAVPGDATQAALAPDGQTVALGDPEGTLHVWDVKAAREIRQWQVNQIGFAGLTFSPDGKTLATRGVDRIVHLWDPTTGKDLREIGEAKEGETAINISVVSAVRGSDIPNLCFSSDGATLVAIPPGDARLFRPARGQTAALRLWDVSTGRAARPFDPLDAGVVAFAAAPDGRTIATATADGSVLLWETLTGKVRLRIRPAAKGAADALAFSPDSRTLAGSSPGGTIRLWEAVTGQELGALTGHQGVVHTLQFTPDGKALLSGSADTTALIWDIDPMLKAARARPTALEDGAAEAMWHALTIADAERAQLAVIKLVGAANRVVPVLRDRLHPVPIPDAEKIAQWLDAVDSKELAVRQKAFAELDRLADLAEQPLKDALAGQPSLERRQRLERLQDRLLTAASLSAEQMQALRAVEILEQIGTPEARAVLQDLAHGANGARLTRQAQAALERLNKQ